MYLVTQEPEDHHSGQVPLQALGFLCWGPSCPAEKVSKPFAFLRRGICVNVNLYLTNGILSLRMYQYLMIYYQCFHQVINEGLWQKAKGLSRQQDGNSRYVLCLWYFPCGSSPAQVGTRPHQPAPWLWVGHGTQEGADTGQQGKKWSLFPSPCSLNQKISPSASSKRELC